MDLHRILSSIVAVIYLVIAYIIGGWGITSKVALFLLLPLACIWFSEEMGGFTGHMKVQITSPTPGIIILIAGWVLLVLPVFAAFIAMLIQ